MYIRPALEGVSPRNFPARMPFILIIVKLNPYAHSQIENCMFYILIAKNHEHLALSLSFCPSWKTSLFVLVHYTTNSKISSVYILKQLYKYACTIFSNYAVQQKAFSSSRLLSQSIVSREQLEKTSLLPYTTLPISTTIKYTRMVTDITMLIAIYKTHVAWTMKLPHSQKFPCRLIPHFSPKKLTTTLIQ